MEEIWVRIKDYPDYVVSNTGRVKSYKYKVAYPVELVCPIGSGYRGVTLHNKDGLKRFTVAKLVALHFLAPPEDPDFIIHHKDGNKLNDHVSNIAWISRSDNLLHAHHVLQSIMGWDFDKRGEKHPRARLTEKDVLTIRQLHEAGQTQVEIAACFNVTAAAVFDIVHRRSWRHI